MSANIEFSPSYTLLTIELAQGESIKAEPGGYGRASRASR